MLHLNYANQTEALLECLAEGIRMERASAEGQGVWEPTLIVVPNPFMKEHVRQELARRLGVAANLRFAYLNGLWKELLRGGATHVLRSGTLRLGLLQALTDRAFLDLPGIEPLKHYLGRDADRKKLVQIATELARVFEEYHYSRPEWIRCWRENQRAPGADPATEAWQRALWRRMVGALDSGGERHETLGEAIAGGRLKAGDYPRSVHVFGLSHVAQVYHDIYRRLGALEHTELHLYALNPCAEFWEDLRSDAEIRNRRPGRAEARRGPWKEEAELGSDEPEPDPDRDFYRLSAEGPEALRRWGRPGRENIRLLNEASDCEFRPEFHLPDGESLLGRIQADILLYQDPSAESGPRDGSVRFLAAPSPRREAELVATEIWRLMERHASEEVPLGFSDIAVIVPPAAQETYLAHLQAAFLETHHIPWVQGDGMPPVLGQTLGAVELLLELPTSGLTRASLLRLLAHPALARRFGGLEPASWTRWCDALGIVRGQDREAWAGSYLDRDALNWDQGLKRLALGAFMADEGELEVGAERYPAFPVADGESAGTFLTLVRGMMADAVALQTEWRDPASWVERLGEFLSRWLEAEDEASLRALGRIRTCLAGLVEGTPEGLEMPTLSFAAARFLALDSLGSLRNQNFASLTKGVIVSSYTPMRAIPFRATFLMGLGEGVFPARDSRSALDMRARNRHPGDVSQTEKDKYLFLETLLSTREHFILSHVALDELSGEAQEPSGLFKEFRGLVGRYLAPEWAPGKEGDPLLESHPLRRFDPAYFPEWFPPEAGARREELRMYAPVAQAEARARWLRQELAEGRPLDLPPTLAELPAPAETRALLEEWLGAPGRSRATLPEGSLRISLGDLKRWLECPLTGAAAVRVGLRQEGLEDRAAVEDERFESDFLDTWGLVRRVAMAALRDGTAPEAAYDACLARLQARAEAPFGIFAQREREANLESIRAWVDHLRDQGRPETWRLGPCRSLGAAADHPQGPLVLSVPLGERTLRVELIGELREQLGGSLFLESGKPPSDPKALWKKAVGAYLDHLVLACVEASHQGHRARFVFTESKNGSRELEFPFRSWKPGEAGEILAGWVGALLTGDHAVLLPIEAVIDAYPEEALTAESIRNWVDEKLDAGERFGGRFSTTYGPVPDPTRYAPPADPQSLVMARYGDFLSQMRNAALSERVS